VFKRQGIKQNYDACKGVKWVKWVKYVLTVDKAWRTAIRRCVKIDIDGSTPRP